MAEHAVRLRAAWMAALLDLEGPSDARVDLPIDWARFRPAPSGVPGRVRLTRRFGRPATPGAETLRARLVLDAAEGVRSVSLNGEPLACRETGPGRLEADLPTLAARNVLALEVEPPNPPPAAWGEVALIFSAPSGPGPAAAS